MIFVVVTLHVVPTAGQAFGERVGRPHGAVLCLLVGGQEYPPPERRRGPLPLTHRRVLTSTLSAWARIVGGATAHERLVVDVALEARMLVGSTSDGDTVVSPGSPTLEARVGGVFDGVAVTGALGVVVPVSGVLDPSREDDPVNEVAASAHAELDRWLAEDAMLGPLLGVEVAHAGAWHLVAVGLRGAIGGRLRDWQWSGGGQLTGVAAARLGPVTLGGRFALALPPAASVTAFGRLDLDGPFIELAVLYGGQTALGGGFHDTVSAITAIGWAVR